MPNLSAVNDLRERLKPLRRLFDDLDKAAAVLAEVDNAVKVSESEVAKLAPEIAKLTAERDQAAREADEARKQRGVALAELNSDVAVARAKSKAEQDKLAEQVDVKRKGLEQAEREYSRRLKEIHDQQVVAEAALAQVQSELAAARQEAHRRLAALAG